MESMETDWQLFIAIAEEGNITKAANRLYVSQPALTYRLQQLEKQFTSPLFIRNSRGVTLTEMGELYYDYARDMLRRKQDFEDSMANQDNIVKGTLRLGVSSIYANYILPSLLEGFTQAFPDVRLHIQTGISSKIASMFQAGDVQLAIVRGPQAISGESIVLDTDQICLVTNKRLPMAPWPREDLLHLPFIRYSTAHDLYQLIDTWWKEQYDVPPNDSIRVDTMDTCRQFIRKHLGWSILPNTGLDKLSDEFTVEPLYWKDGTPIVRETNLYYHKESLHRKTIKAFVNYISCTVPVPI